MSNKYYSTERNVQILLSVLKANGIKRIVASPGSTNVCFVGSVQQDPFFEVFSCVDERSAVYIACGMAAESGEPVVLSCTGATASRNYYSGLTEAYYRKLPILAVTSHQGTDRIGHLIAQNIDRRQLPKDIVKVSVDIPFIHDNRDEHYAAMEINKAVIELFRRGGGPAHINIHTRYSPDYSVKELPACPIIRYHNYESTFPELPKGNIAINIGAHKHFSETETEIIDNFCSACGAVVFCDHTSGYYGLFRLQAAVLFSQRGYKSSNNDFSLMIHLGEVTGDYTLSTVHAKEVWRVNPDGEIRDTYGNLTHVFEMEESHFFSHYSETTPTDNNTVYSPIKEEISKIRESIPDLSLSNVWIAQQTAPFFPPHSRVHLGILNSLRTWNFFDFPSTVEGYSNVGGFGIDGTVSSLIGASLIKPQQLFFGVFGDLSFFYDMNVIGNRHVGNNVRILIINNGKGAEFRVSTPCNAFGDEADHFMAAAGHFGNKSRDLVRHYAVDLGYEYLSATTKEEYLRIRERFLLAEMTDKPMILEVFTDSRDEVEMQERVCNAVTDTKTVAKSKVANAVRGIMGEGAVTHIKHILGK